MRPLSVFRTLTNTDSRLGFYTIETKAGIPSIPGCYAWFLPLWIYNDNLSDLVKIVAKILNFDHDPEKQVEVSFNWESIKMNVSRRAAIRTHESAQSTWERVISSDDGRDALQQTLLEASLLMPPLYVGRTNNLRRRYLEHTEERSHRPNDFNRRFYNHMMRLGLELTVSDLLFVCIRTPSDLVKTLDEYGDHEIEILIEHVLMQFCRPPFSIR